MISRSNRFLRIYLYSIEKIYGLKSFTCHLVIFSSLCTHRPYDFNIMSNRKRQQQGLHVIYIFFTKNESSKY